MSVAEHAADFFISHAAADTKAASALRVALEGAGYAVSSVGDIPSGADWGDALRDALRGARAFVAVLTPASVHSQWLALELGAAWVENKPIRLILTGIKPVDLPPYLMSYPTILAKDPATVVADLGAALGSPRSKRSPARGSRGAAAGSKR